MSTPTTRRLLEGFGYAESARWHAGELWFVDFFSGHVHAATLDGQCRTVATVPGMPGGLGFLPDGTPLVVSQREFRLYAIRGDGRLQPHAELADHARGAANDLLVDAAGRAYVGHHGFDFYGGAAPQPSSLLLVDLDGHVREVADGLTFPNGMTLSDDRRTLVLAESFAARLSAFDVARDGTLGARRDWALIPGHTPDGLCLDSAGAAWFGSPLSASFVRVAEGGEILDTVATEEQRWAVSCAFVGDSRADLAMLTAATSLEGMPQGKSRAFVELLRAPVPGARS